MEIFTLVKQRSSLAYQFLGAFVLLIAVLSLVGSFFIYLLIISAVVFGCLWFFFFYHLCREFEYSYFEDEMRFARISNKSRRKSLYTISMDDVIQIAPVGDRSITNYEKDRSFVHKDMSSKLRGHLVYELAARQDNKAPVLIKFEPDDRLLDAIEARHRQKLVRVRNIEGSQT